MGISEILTLSHAFLQRESFFEQQLISFSGMKNISLRFSQMAIQKKIPY